MQTWLSKSEIACLEHPQLLRKGENIVLTALNSIFVIRGGRRVHIRLGCIFANLRHGLAELFFWIRMFCLRLCPVLLHFYIEIRLFAFILIKFWQETAAKMMKILGLRGVAVQIRQKRV